ncbi:MAG: DNA polymerase domain-containing protein, partial [Petrotogales bacterium]
MKYLVTKVDYQIVNNEPILLIRWRDEDNNCGIFKKEGFKPYFYAPKDEIKDERIYKTLFGEEVSKVEVQVPPDVPKLRSKYSRTWEADILFPTRFLIDSKIRSGFKLRNGKEIQPCEVTMDEVKMTKMFVDIETESPEGASDPNKAEDRVLTISITYIDENKGEEKNFILHDKDERKMLNQFLDLVEKFDPDVLTAWFAFFDFATIKNRCEKLNLDYKRMSPTRYVDTRHFGNKDFFKCSGRVVTDLMEVYSSYYKNQTIESKRLEDVAEDEVGIPQSDFDYSKLAPEKWPTYIDQIKEYNKVDVERMVKLDQKLELINHFDRIRRMVGCQFQDSMQTSRYTDVLMLREYNDEYICPNKPTGGQEHQGYTGGFVMTPEAGLHEWVIVLDFSAMYPTIIESYNISPETLLHEEKENTYKIEADNDVYYFKKNPRGKLPNIFEKLEEYRNETKELRNQYGKDNEEWKKYDDKQYGLKQIIDCVPGDTRVITKQGVKNIENINIGDKVWSCNKEAEYSWKPVVDKVKKKSNKLVEINFAGDKFICTPGHHMIKYWKGSHKNDTNKYSWKSEIVEASELKEGDFVPVPNDDTINVDGWGKNESIAVTDLNGFSEKDGKRQPAQFNKLDFGKFLVWVVEEGSLYLDNESGHKCITITQKNKTEEIENLMAKLNINYIMFERDNGCKLYKISFGPLVDYINERMDEGSKLPNWILNCNKEVAKDLLQVSAITDEHKVSDTQT